MSSGFDVQPGRLNGWKEIAVHLGKGTRTAQRWERLYGLPVHRTGREGGEIVYAFRSEIDLWLKKTALERGLEDEPSAPALPPPSPRPPDHEPEATPGARLARGRWLGVAALLAAVLVAIVVLARLRPGEHTDRTAGLAAAGQPASWKLAGGALTVFDEGGGVLFVHRFGFLLDGTTLTSEAPGSLPVLVADVDGDGRSEVLALPNALERANRKLWCFEADGRVRFVHQPTGTRRFGDEEYGEPWLAHRVFSTRGAGGTRRVWAVFIHNLLFPSVLRELDARDGTVLQEYWSNGYISLVHEDTWAGRPVVLVGATNNDFRAASLAVFAPDRVAGSTPAALPGYTCRDCPPGGPESLYVFPSLCAARAGGQADLLEAWVEGGDRLRVTVDQGASSTGVSPTYYTLGPGGALLSVEVSHEFRAEHARLERGGLLDHPFGPRDERDLFPVRRWDGRRFVELPPVAVSR